MTLLDPQFSCDILVFGGTGDLALRKLLPALYHLHSEPRSSTHMRVFCIARRQLSDQEFIGLVKSHCQEQIAANEFNDQLWEQFAQKLKYFTADFQQSSDMQRLAEYLDDGGDRVRVHYLATAPSLYVPIARRLAEVGLAGPLSRIVLEKPIGHSLESAQAINQAIGETFDESRIFRIDHYLGKETVQNIMAMRFANLMFEPTWRASYVDHVQITVSETLGVEGRGGYYDHSGAMRDMIQNHLLQLLCLIAMEPPARYDADSVSSEKLKVLQSLRPIGGPQVAAKTVRGQYVAGKIGDRQVPAYRDEPTVAENSDTETFVAIEAQVDNWRWHGVPFYLRTGKRMEHKRSEILIQFKPVPLDLFGGVQQPNSLLIGIQPEESLSSRMMAKLPGKGMSLEPLESSLNFAGAFGGGRRRWDAYERLLLDIIEGDTKLFMHRDEVEAAWRWVDPIIQSWQHSEQAPLPYPAGSNGPDQAQALLAKNGHHWHD